MRGRRRWPRRWSASPSSAPYSPRAVAVLSRGGPGGQGCPSAYAARKARNTNAAQHDRRRPAPSQSPAVAASSAADEAASTPSLGDVVPCWPRPSRPRAACWTSRTSCCWPPSTDEQHRCCTRPGAHRACPPSTSRARSARPLRCSSSVAAMLRPRQLASANGVPRRPSSSRARELRDVPDAVGRCPSAKHTHDDRVVELLRDRRRRRRLSRQRRRHAGRSSSSAQIFVKVGRSNGRAAAEHLGRGLPPMDQTSARASHLRRAEELLGRHVLRRAEHDARLRQLVELRLVVLPLGDPEVQDLDDVRPVRALRDEEVGRLEVAVDDAVRVRLGDALADLHRVVDGERDGQRAARLDHLPEVRPLQVVHHHVGHVIAPHADVDDARDVLVLELLRRSDSCLGAGSATGRSSVTAGLRLAGSAGNLSATRSPSCRCVAATTMPMAVRPRPRTLVDAVLAVDDRADREPTARTARSGLSSGSMPAIVAQDARLRRLARLQIVSRAAALRLLRWSRRAS